MTEIRPVGYGMSGYPWRIAYRHSLDHPAKCWLGGSNPSHRTLRDGSSLAIIPGNELPGYDHIVPTGHDKKNTAPNSKGMRNCRTRYG